MYCSCMTYRYNFILDFEHFYRKHLILISNLECELIHTFLSIHNPLMPLDNHKLWTTVKGTRSITYKFAIHITANSLYGYNE